jgi:hypothetical protein
VMQKLNLSRTWYCPYFGQKNYYRPIKLN